MRFVSEDNESTLELQPCEAEGAMHPSVCFTVSACSPDVSGGVARVWIESSSLEQFHRGLLGLHETRDGRAYLESMSPDEFSCEVFAINSRGHIGLGFTLTGTRWADSSVFPFTLSAGFQMDPTSLPMIAADIRALLSQQQQKASSSS